MTTRRPRQRVALAILAIWAVSATGFAVENHREVRRLAEEAEIQRAAHDDKVRALTRRLVGVASHGMLEQEGLAGRLADIITRQVELETRQAALAAATERAITGAMAPAAALPAAAVPPGGPADANDRPRPGRGTTLDGDLTRPPGLGDSPGGTAALPLREQFARIEGSLARVDAAQDRAVDRLLRLARAGIERVRTVFADLHLAIVPVAAPPRPAPAQPNAFAARIDAADDAVSEAGRWRSAAEAVPLRAPIEADGNLTSNFGLRKDPFTGAARMHAGMDFRSPVGTPVRTGANGRVVVAGSSSGYGNLVEIDHGHDVVTRYGHLSVIEVAVGQPVPAGTRIGLVGSTGRSTGPHLHYETRIAGTAVDPARFLAAGQRLFGSPALLQGAAPEPETPEAADAAD